MPGVLPYQFLFRYAFPIKHLGSNAPLKLRSAAKLTASRPFGLKGEFRLQQVGALDDQPSFGLIDLAWNEQGLAVGVSVSGKQTSLVCDPKNPTESDGLQIWIDTRDTQSIHRAGRFCHHFCLLPSGGGSKQDKPFARQLPIARSREETSLAEPGQIPVTAKTTKDGYRLEAWFPAELLTGFDPETHPRMGFYYALRDSELGEQFLTVNNDFPFAHDPSVWSTLELIR